MGTFDGVHLGHQELIKKCADEAKKNDAYSLVITFPKHPRLIFDSNQKINFITNDSEKLALIKLCGINGCFVMPFDEKIASISPEKFVKKILVDLIGVKKIFVGFNFTYGRFGHGNTTTLREYAKKYDFSLYVLNIIRKNGFLVSSSNIRLLLSSGVVEKSEFFLGRSYSISGKIVRGKSIGKIVGFPTANIEIEKCQKMLPLSGVYASFVRVGGNCYEAVVNIGKNPTISDGSSSIKVETHILDFSGNIYGKRLKIYFKKRLRDEIKFDNLEDLRETIGRDVLRTKKFFKRCTN